MELDRCHLPTRKWVFPRQRIHHCLHLEMSRILNCKDTFLSFKNCPVPSVLLWQLGGLGWTAPCITSDTVCRLPGQVALCRTPDSSQCVHRASRRFSFRQEDFCKGQLFFFLKQDSFTFLFVQVFIDGQLVDHRL